MDWDEPLSGSKPAPVQDLSVLSIDELRDYVSSLKTEIQRAEATLASKAAHSTAAGTIFGPKTSS